MKYTINAGQQALEACRSSGHLVHPIVPICGGAQSREKAVDDAEGLRGQGAVPLRSWAAFVIQNRGMRGHPARAVRVANERRLRRQTKRLDGTLPRRNGVQAPRHWPAHDRPRTAARPTRARRSANRDSPAQSPRQPAPRRCGRNGRPWREAPPRREPARLAAPGRPRRPPGGHGTAPAATARWVGPGGRYPAEARRRSRSGETLPTRQGRQCVRRRGTHLDKGCAAAKGPVQAALHVWVELEDLQPDRRRQVREGV